MSSALLVGTEELRNLIGQPLNGNTRVCELSLALETLQSQDGDFDLLVVDATEARGNQVRFVGEVTRLGLGTTKPMVIFTNEDLAPFWRYNLQSRGNLAIRVCRASPGAQLGVLKPLFTGTA